MSDRLVELAEEYMRMLREDRRERGREPLREAMALERRPLRKTNFGHVSNLPALVAPFRIVVPGAYWTMVALDTVEVSCPCGEVPRMTSGRPVVCPGPQCPRAYLYSGRDVLVAFSPKGTEPIPEPNPDDEV